jgi:hypothetical protein
MSPLVPRHAAAATLLVLLANASAQDPAEAGLKAIAKLAQVNGQALACDDRATAQRAKALMLSHAPKTARFGDAFETGTHEAFLAQTRQGACPPGPALASRLDAIAAELQAALPAAAPAK